MTRRNFVSLAAACAANGRPSLPQTPAVRTSYRDYSRSLPDFLRTLASQAYERRNREIAALTSAEAISRRQRWVTETFWKLVGGKPESTPLNARVTGSFERPGYRVEKLVYESQPNLHVSANLYVPTVGRPPFPGILFQMGHTVNGKAGDLYQKCCQGLAHLGYLVLAFDPMGQGERTYYPGPAPSRTRLAGTADDEHTIPGKQMLLVGDSAARMQVWDAVRSLDYLAAHPLVDAKRLASTGQSGGGTITMLLAAVDERLAAAAVACANTENVACANFNPPGSTDDAEQNFPGGGPLGFDRWDLLYPLAPKPLLILPSAKDFAGTYSPNYMANGWEEFRKLRGVYETLGKPDRIGWYESPLPHGLAYDMRLQIYNWFGRWLKGETKLLDQEPPVSPEAESALFATKEGSVVRAFRGETPFTMTRKRKLARQPVPLDQLLGIERPEAGIQAATLGRTSFRNVIIEAIEIPAVPTVWLPAWLFQPSSADRSKPVVLLVEPGGRARWQEGALYDELASEGCVVCALDVRGIGDLAPEYSRGAARHARSHNSEHHYAWSSLILGKPLLGQRVTDILAAARALRSRQDLTGRRLVVAARGTLTAPAQFAAALDTGIDLLYLAGGLISYRNILETEEYRGGPYHFAGDDRSNSLFGSFVPNLLRHTDLPELMASMVPRRGILAGPVDAAGRTFDVAAAAKLYESASNVSIVAEASWEAEALRRAIAG